MVWLLVTWWGTLNLYGHIHRLIIECFRLVELSKHVFAFSLPSFQITQQKESHLRGIFFSFEKEQWHNYKRGIFEGRKRIFLLHG